MHEWYTNGKAGNCSTVFSSHQEVAYVRTETVRAADIRPFDTLEIGLADGTEIRFFLEVGQAMGIVRGIAQEYNSPVVKEVHSAE